MAREERDRRWKELVAQYAPRRPMAKLADKYHVTETNPDPPLVHFAFPVNADVLYKYAKKHGLIEYLTHLPGQIVSPVTLIVATEHLSEKVGCELFFCWPFEYTSESDVILALYSNYTMDELKLAEEKEKKVITSVQENLGLNESVRPKWYFNSDDPWEPGMEE